MSSVTEPPPPGEPAAGAAHETPDMSVTARKARAAEALEIYTASYDQAIELLKSLGSRVAHKTYGEGLKCAVYSLSEGLAASDDDKCYYARFQKASHIASEINEFVDDEDKFRAYCDKKIRAKLNLDEEAFREYKAHCMGDNFDWAASSNIEIETLCFIVDFWEEQHPEDSPIDLLLVETFHQSQNTAGVAPQVRCAYHIRPRPDAKKQIAIRSVDCGNAAVGSGHYEVFLSPIPLTDHDDEESYDGHPRIATNFDMATDPRLNGGHIPPSHKCDPVYNPCSKKPHKVEYPSKPAEYWKQKPGSEDSAAADASTQPQSKDVKPDADQDPVKEAPRKLHNKEDFKIADDLFKGGFNIAQLAKMEEPKLNSEETVFFEGLRLAVPKEIPPAPERWEAQGKQYEKVKLIKLEQPKPTDGIAFYGIKDWGFSIGFINSSVMQCDDFIPVRKIHQPHSAASAEEGEPRVVASLSRLSIAPAIKLTFYLRRGKKIGKSNRYEREHNGSAIFPFNRVYDHTSKKHVQGIRHGSFSATWREPESTTPGQSNEKESYLELKFIADFVITDNIMPPQQFGQKTPAEWAIIGLLKKIAESPGSKVTIRLYPFVADVEAAAKKGSILHELPLRQAFACLPGQASPAAGIKEGRNVFAYRRKLNPDKIGVQFKNLKSRWEIARSATPFVLMPPTFRFIDNAHAEVVLGYGHQLCWQEEQNHLLALTNDTHVCTVHRIVDTVVVGIRFHANPDSGLGASFYSLQSNTKLVLSITDAEQNDPIKAKGITTDMDLDMTPPASVHVLITGKEAAKLHRIAHPGLHHSNPTRHAVNIQPEINNTVITAQMDAIHKAYDDTAVDGSHGALLPLLLYNGRESEVHDPWEGCRDQELASKAFAELKEELPWTETQQEVIDLSKNMKLRMALVKAPGGTGKTELQVRKGHANVKAGDKVVFLSDRNAVLDTICRKYVSKYPDDEPPVRAYAKQLSASSLAAPGSNLPDAEQKFTDEDLAIFNILEEKRKAARESRFALEEYSVEGHIRYHIEEGTSYLIQFTDGQEETKPGEPMVAKDDPKMPQPVNAFEFLANCLNRISAFRDARAQGTSPPEKTSLNPQAGGENANNSEVSPEYPTAYSEIKLSAESASGDLGTAHNEGENKQSPGIADEIPSAAYASQEIEASLKNAMQDEITPDAPQTSNETGQLDVSPAPASEESKPSADEAAQKESTPTSEPLFTEDEQRWFDQAYTACRQYVLKNAKVLLSTAVNCGKDEVRKYFATGPDDRVWLEVDEATTIHEASMLIPLAKCYQTWGYKIVSVWMYGDPKQLGPVVIGSDGQNGRPAYNEFISQLHVSLFMRLIRCGFAVTELPDQARMHPVLWEEVNRIFYDNKIEFMGNLQDFELPSGYESMVRKLFNYSTGDVLSEKQLRLRYIEVPGSNTRRSRDTGSRANMANFVTVMNLITRDLHELYGEKMYESVGLITPYQRQRQMYAVAFKDLREAGWSVEALPMLATVDSVVGNERDHIILDYVVSIASPRGMGFMRDDKRNCVAHSRARKIMWIIGSDFFNPIVAAESKAQAQAAMKPGNIASQSTAPAPAKRDVDKAEGSKKKKSNQRYDQDGEEMAEYTLVEFRDLTGLADSRGSFSDPAIHETDWPIDLWREKYLPGLEAVKEKSKVKVGAGGFLHLSKGQQDLVISETAAKEQQKERQELKKQQLEAEAAKREAENSVPDEAALRFNADMEVVVTEEGFTAVPEGNTSTDNDDGWGNSGDGWGPTEPCNDNQETGNFDAYPSDLKDDILNEQQEMGENEDTDEADSDANGESNAGLSEEGAGMAGEGAGGEEEIGEEERAWGYEA